MSFVSRIASVMNFSQRSLENTMNTIKEVHQTVVEIPINVAEDLGLPKETATSLRTKHRQVLDHLHGGIVDACGTVNQYIVDQAQAVNDFARDQWEPPRSTVVDFKNKTERQRKSAG